MNGATICMVTHDPRYARHAERNIYLFDGRVVAEPPEELEVPHVFRTPNREPGTRNQEL
jgi:ABC-type lipoprotein export system ATPase subunit